MPLEGRWSLLALLMLISATNQLHRISLPAVGDQILEAYSFSEKELGVLYSVFLWVYTACMFPGGILLDRVGAWRTLSVVLLGSSLAGLLTGALGWLALAPAAAWWWIAAVRGGMGVLSAPIYPSTSRAVASWFEPRERALANSLVIGAALAGVAGAQKLMSVLSARLGWRAAFVVIGAGTLLVLAAWAFLGSAAPGSRHGPARPDAAPPGARGGSWDWLRLFAHPGVLLLTLSYATVGYFEYLFFYWSKHYFKEILKLSEDAAADRAAIPSLAMMVGTPLGGLACIWAARRWGLKSGLRRVAVVSMTLAAAFLALGALADGLGAKVALFSLALGVIGASEGPFWTAAVQLGGARHGGASGGFVNTGGNLLGSLAPAVTPVLASRVNAAWGSADPLLGWTAALIAGAAVCLAGVCFWAWVDVERPLE
ncbi:MAG: MFS transporter [Planctomycetes bacterium]|nr:MFS transporter [Planctomycetota bacterium]